MRACTQDQDLALQIKALKDAGCEAIYQEKVSGAIKLRPQLEKMLEHLRRDDVVVIWNLDCLARS